MRGIASFCMLATMAGCATVEMSSVGKMNGGDRLLVIQDSGYELLSCIPIWSGSLTWDSRKNDVTQSPAFFRDDSDTQHLYEMAKRIAERENCDLVDVTFIDNYNALDLASFYGAIQVSDTAISAVLRPRK